MVMIWMVEFCASISIPVSTVKASVEEAEDPPLDTVAVADTAVVDLPPATAARPLRAAEDLRIEDEALPPGTRLPAAPDHPLAAPDPRMIERDPVAP